MYCKVVDLIVGDVVRWLRALRMKSFVQGAWTTLHNYVLVHMKVNSQLHDNLMPTIIYLYSSSQQKIRPAVNNIFRQFKYETNTSNNLKCSRLNGIFTHSVL